MQQRVTHIEHWKYFRSVVLKAKRRIPGLHYIKRRFRGPSTCDSAALFSPDLFFITDKQQELVYMSQSHPSRSQQLSLSCLPFTNTPQSGETLFPKNLPRGSLYNPLVCSKVISRVFIKVVVYIYFWGFTKCPLNWFHPNSIKVFLGTSKTTASAVKLPAGYFYERERVILNMMANM